MTQQEINNKVKMYADYFQAMFSNKNLFRSDESFMESLDNVLTKADPSRLEDLAAYACEQNHVEARNVNGVWFITVEALRDKVGEDYARRYYQTALYLNIFWGVKPIACYKIAVIDTQENKH